jgi:hypothetical protein
LLPIPVKYIPIRVITGFPSLWHIIYSLSFMNQNFKTQLDSAD